MLDQEAGAVASLTQEVAAIADLSLDHPYLWMEDLAMRRSGDCFHRKLDALRFRQDGLELWIVELDYQHVWRVSNKF